MAAGGLSRRPFLRSVWAVGAGLFLLGCQANRAGDSVYWAFVSDIHIDTNPDRVERGGKMSERFKLVLNDVLSSDKPLTGMLINGDVAVARGLPGDYATLINLLEPVRRAKLDVHFVLGNHDDRGNFLKAIYGERPPASPVPGRYVNVVASGGTRLILLDSNTGTNSTLGELGSEQLRWLTQELDKTPDPPCIVFLHHCMRGNSLALKDEKAFTDIVVPRRQVKAVIQGHSHDYRFREVEGIHFVELPGCGYAFRNTDPIGWVRARLTPQGCELELRAIDGNRDLHGQKRQLIWRPAAVRANAA